MTGWRLGYAAGPQSIIEAANVVQSHSLSNVTTFAQYGGIAALEGDQSAVETMRQAFAQRREVIYACVVDSGYHLRSPGRRLLHLSLDRSLGPRTR